MLVFVLARGNNQIFIAVMNMVMSDDEDENSEDSDGSHEGDESEEEDGYILAQRVELSTREKNRVFQLLPERDTYVGVPFVTHLTNTNLKKGVMVCT